MSGSRLLACCLALALSSAALTGVQAGERWPMPAWLARPIVRSQAPDVAPAATGTVKHTGHVGVDDGAPFTAVSYASRPCQTCEDDDCGCSWWARLKDKCRSCRRGLYFKSREHDDCHRLYPECPPFCTPNQGYYPTCWRRIPEFNCCPPPVDPFRYPLDCIHSDPLSPHLAPPPTPATDDDFVPPAVVPAPDAPLPEAPPAPAGEEPRMTLGNGRLGWQNTPGSEAESYLTRQRLIEQGRGPQIYPRIQSSRPAPSSPWEMRDAMHADTEPPAYETVRFSEPAGPQTTVGADAPVFADADRSEIPDSYDKRWRPTRRDAAHRSPSQSLDDLPLD